MAKIETCVREQNRSITAEDRREGKEGESGVAMRVLIIKHFFSLTLASTDGA
jgi:hypothetical protein